MGDYKKWNDIKYKIVFEGNYYKFSQNPELAEILLATGDRILAEASATDKYWGIGLSKKDALVKEWKGENLLGKVLMDVRGSIS